MGADRDHDEEQAIPMVVEDFGSDEKPVTAAAVAVAMTAPTTPSNAYQFHPAVYVAVWISLSSAVILFNKWILFSKEFKFPILLTTWHLVFATIATQALARTTTLLDGRKSVPINGRTYVRAIAPIGFFFSLSLICGNQAYLYLSVAFIQMLKATTPVAVLLATWGTGLESPNLRILGNVSFIVVGVMLASWGEIAFDMTGFLFQVFGIAFEATRLVMVQRLLSSAEFKMDPLVSLYYFAPVCTVMNFLMFLVFEARNITFEAIYNVGLFTLLLNALVAFGLNVSVVFLIGRTSSLVLTLCGVLKDILLVLASILIWNTTVTMLQFLGYSFALAGLVYYKLGADKIKEQYHALGLSRTADKIRGGNRIVIYAVAAVVIIVLAGLALLGSGSSVELPALQKATSE